MQRTALERACVSILIAALSAACSSGEDSPSPSLDQAREFSAEDKRAARALSISNNQAVTNADTPYVRALLCRNGIEALAEQVQKARGLSEEQRQGMEQARAYFHEQVLTLGAREDRSESEIRSDLEEVAQDHVDAGENAQIANACLRRLLET